MKILPKAAVSHQGLQLRSEQQQAAIVVVIQRFDAQPIPAQEQLLLGRIPEGESEHASETRQTIDTPFVIGMQDDFRIGVGDKPVSLSGELVPDFPVVINLAVEGDSHGAGRIRHRLPASRRKVEDG